jgi:hypothetical protein
MQGSRLAQLQFKKLIKGGKKDKSMILPSIRKQSPNDSTSTHFD